MHGLLLAGQPVVRPPGGQAQDAAGTAPPPPQRPHRCPASQSRVSSSAPSQYSEPRILPLPRSRAVHSNWPGPGGVIEISGWGGLEPLAADHVVLPGRAGRVTHAPILASLAGLPGLPGYRARRAGLSTLAV